MIYLLLHNIRSIHNVGSILRTADGFGVKKVIFSGYTPYPKLKNDSRLPHISNRQTSLIHKTALGAEEHLDTDRVDSPLEAIDGLREQGFRIVGLEQDQRSIMLKDYTPPSKILLILGEEVAGIDDSLKNACDDLLEIPMRGKKESFNVSVAAGIALYELVEKHK